MASATSISFPGIGKMGGVYVHIIGAETLKAGTPVDLGWVPLFLLALAPRVLAVLAASAAAPAALIFGLAARRAVARDPRCRRRITSTLDITPALFVLITVASVLGWRRYRVRGLVNPVSNLPNLNALRANREGRKPGAGRRAHPELRGDRRRAAAEQRASTGRPDRLAADGRRSQAHALPGRRRHLRLVRGTGAAVRQPSRGALLRCSATRPG